MTQQIINITPPGAGTGDTLYVGGGKINANFTELYNNVSNQNIFYVTTAVNPFNAEVGLRANIFNFYGYDGTEQFRVESVYNSSNYVGVHGANSLNPPSIFSAGADTDVGFSIASKGLAPIYLGNGAGTHVWIDDLGNGNAANYWIMYGNTNGSSPLIQVAGADANLDMRFQPKGTGTMRFGTYTASSVAITADMTSMGSIGMKDFNGTARKMVIGT